MTGPGTGSYLGTYGGARDSNTGDLFFRVTQNAEAVNFSSGVVLPAASANGALGIITTDLSGRVKSANIYGTEGGTGSGGSGRSTNFVASPDGKFLYAVGVLRKNISIGLAGTLTASDATKVDGFALKINASSGDVVWGKSAGNAGADDYFSAVAVDSAGNVYIGEFSGIPTAGSIMWPSLPSLQQWATTGRLL
jgi:hypothetical protein